MIMTEEPTADNASQYRSLVVTTCEWRAFGLADPNDMADLVFERVAKTPGKSFLRQVYKFVDDVTSEVYADVAKRRPIWDGFAGTHSGVLKGSGDPTIDQTRAALTSLSGRDVELLRQAYWDTLTLDEMAEVNGSPPAVQQTKLNLALTRFQVKLPASLAGDPVSALRLIKPGTHWRHEIQAAADPDIGWVTS